VYNSNNYNAKNELYFKFRDKESLIADFTSRLKFNYVTEGSSVLEISLVSQNPDRDVDFINKLCVNPVHSLADTVYFKIKNSKNEMNLGIGYPATVELYIGELDPQEIGIEMLLAEEGINGKMNIKEKFDFTFDGSSDGVAYYSCEIKPETAGIYNFAGRIYAKNPKLPHRQDFDLVKWL
jgi:hypothetical protein